MNEVGVSVLIVVIGVVLIAPRRLAAVGVMAGVLYLTQGQRLDVFGFNMWAIRFIEVAGFIRVLVRREFSFARLNTVDRVVLLFYAYTTIVFVLRSSDGRANQIGMGLDALLCYFAFRGLLWSVEDCRWFLRVFLILLGPYVVLVLIESLTLRNPFASMGGTTAGEWMREGRLRCQGSFRHSSLLGTLGASFLPLYIGLALVRASRKLAWMGIGLCLLIVWASNSGGPATCAVVGIVGWLMWRVRRRMRVVRLSLAIGIVVLAAVMKAPVWYLLARISALTGGDGYHRSYLLDVAFQNVGRWWFAGMPIQDTAGWFPYDLGATGGADITNQFVAFGLNAGLVSMMLFIALLALLFRNLGEAMAVARSRERRPGEGEYLLWGLGVVLAIHIVNWLGITYFDQTYVIWSMQLAMMSNLAAEYREIKTHEARFNRQGLVRIVETVPSEPPGGIGANKVKS